MILKDVGYPVKLGSGVAAAAAYLQNNIPLIASRIWYLCNCSCPSIHSKSCRHRLIHYAWLLVLNPSMILYLMPLSSISSVIAGRFLYMDCWNCWTHYWKSKSYMYTLTFLILIGWMSLFVQWKDAQAVAGLGFWFKWDGHNLKKSNSKEV